MKTGKRVLSILLSLLLMLSFGTLAVAEGDEPGTVVASGTCGADGDNLQWELWDDGTLNITGEGAMADYGPSSSTYSPWMDYYFAHWNDYYDALAQSLGYASLDDLSAAYENGQVTEAAITAAEAQIAGTVPTRDDIIKTVNIGENVTSIGALAFHLCRATTISLPSTLKSIGAHAFDTACFTELALPEGLETIGVNAFCSLPIHELTIPSTVTALDPEATMALYYVKKLTFMNPEINIENLLLPTLNLEQAAHNYISYEEFCVDYPTYDVQPVNSPICDRYDDHWTTETDGSSVASWLTISAPCTSTAIAAICARGHVNYEPAHQWGDWYMTQIPENGQPGLEKRVCTACGQPATMEISYSDEWNYTWTHIPASSAGLNEGERYLDLATYFMTLMLYPNLPQDQLNASMNMYMNGTWYVDDTKMTVRGTLTLPGTTETIEVVTQELYGYVKPFINYTWNPLPLSADGLSTGDYYLDLDLVSSLHSFSDDERAAFEAMTYYLDAEKGGIRMVGTYHGAALDMVYNAFFFGIREVGIQWVPVHFYTDGLQEGDWYFDFDEEYAMMVEQGIYASYDGDGPHVRAMYERLGYENSYYINANPNSKLCKYMVSSSTQGNEPGEVWNSTAIHPLTYYANSMTAYPGFMNNTPRLDRVIKQYHAADFADRWTSIPTSPDGLADGEFYLDFSYKTDDDYRPENTAEAVAMYNNGEWFINEDATKLKGSIDIPASIYPHNQTYHMVYDPSSMVLPYVLREVGVDWRSVALTTDDLRVGDWYLDQSVFFDEWAAYVANRRNSDRDATNDITAAEVRAELDEQGTLSFLFSNGFEIYKGSATELYRFQVPTPGDGYLYPTETVYAAWQGDGLFTVMHNSVKQYEGDWMQIPTSDAGLNPGELYLDLAAFAAGEPDLYALAQGTNAWYVEKNTYAIAYTTAQSTSKQRVDAASDYLKEAGERWVYLPYSTDGLSDGDLYFDAVAFINAIGKDKTAAERQAAYELLLQHVVFYYNPNGNALSIRYDYTDFPGEDGAPPDSGSTYLPIDLTRNPEIVFQYDYNAVQNSIKTYVAPAEPEEPGQRTPNFVENTILLFKSFIRTFLSFFRRLFG